MFKIGTLITAKHNNRKRYGAIDGIICGNRLGIVYSDSDGYTNALVNEDDIVEATGKDRDEAFKSALSYCNYIGESLNFNAARIAQSKDMDEKEKEWNLAIIADNKKRVILLLESLKSLI